jgi:hypothetical protein
LLKAISALSRDNRDNRLPLLITERIDANNVPIHNRTLYTKEFAPITQRYLCSLLSETCCHESTSWKSHRSQRHRRLGYNSTTRTSWRERLHYEIKNRLIKIELLH